MVCCVHDAARRELHNANCTDSLLGVPDEHCTTRGDAASVNSPEDGRRRSRTADVDQCARRRIEKPKFCSIRRRGRILPATRKDTEVGRPSGATICFVWLEGMPRPMSISFGRQ